MKILIVEDTCEHYLAAKRACEEAGLEYKLASTMEDALNMLGKANMFRSRAEHIRSGKEFSIPTGVCSTGVVTLRDIRKIDLTIREANEMDRSELRARLIDYFMREASAAEFDGVISDIFMPYRNDHHRSRIVPGGVGVAVRAQMLGLPFVLCTAGYHHGEQYDWICQMGRGCGWPEMVDCSPDSGGDSVEGLEKDWPRAIQVLRGLIAARTGAG